MLVSLQRPPEIEISDQQVKDLEEDELPIYSILCPLYKEWEVLGQFVKAIKNIDWPKDRLDVLLLLEENDEKTIETAKAMGLPGYFRIIIVPHSLPKTKPKACNYGLNLARGEYLVIYDAEDMTERDQLKKAYLAFRQVDKKVFCLQAKLNYYNSSSNWLTRLFTAEYCLWFDVILPGLQSINTIIPLGGTSNHFRTKGLQKLHGWDAFNVTEDCDLGARIFKDGLRTAVFNSTTWEEANSNLKNWLRQRSRWIKGYWQTFLVHNRQPLKFLRQQGLHALIFQLVIGLRTTFVVINPLLWLMTLSYFFLTPITGGVIHALYPGGIFYVAALCLVFGNFFYLYSYMIGLAKREQWGLVKYVFLVPFYWVMMSVSAALAFYQLIVKPYYWEKTLHGLHLKKKESPVAETMAVKTGIWAKPGIKRPETSPLMTEGMGLVLASLAAGGLNLAYSVMLGRRLDLEEMGVMAAISNALILAGVTFGAWSDTVTHKIGVNIATYGLNSTLVWSWLRRKSFIAGKALVLIWLVLIPLWQRLFSVDMWPVLFFCPVWLLGIVAATDKGFLSGNLKFGWVGLFLVIEAVGKLAIGGGILWAGMDRRLLYGAIPLSMGLGLLGSQIYIGKYLPDKGVKEAKYRDVPWGFLITAVGLNAATTAFISLDVILAKVFLSATAAGEYALAALMGKMVYITGTIVGQFILPLVSFGNKGREDYKGRWLIVATAIASLATFGVCGWGGRWSGRVLFGDKIEGVVQLLPSYGLAMVFLAIGQALTSWHQSRKEYGSTVVSLTAAVAMAVGIGLNHGGVAEVVEVMLIVSGGYLLVLLGAEIAGGILRIGKRNLKDLAGLWEQKQLVASGAGKSIVIFNWRDIGHIWAGGAEVYIHELGKKLVQWGWRVTVFCGNDGVSPGEETIDGVKIIRRGGFFTVYLMAPLYYLFRLRRETDVVIDSENGIPFFTPLFVRKPVLGLVHHVHQEVFRRNLAAPLSSLACFLEGKLMPKIYRNTRMMTVSASSKMEMEDLGLGKKYPIAVVNPGVELNKFKTGKKTEQPTILYLGRLKAYKSIETLIGAAGRVKENHPNLKVKIAGFGESRKDLEKLATSRGLTDVVEFLGKVSEKVKRRLMAESWVFVYPSTMEGWGISVVEANAAGTAVVASRVPGLVDSLSNPHSGFLVPARDEEAFAEKIGLILDNAKLRRRLELGARAWAKKFSWDKSANQLFELISLMEAENEGD